MCGFGVGVGDGLRLGDFVGSMIRESMRLVGGGVGSVKLRWDGGFGWDGEGVEC